MIRLLKLLFGVLLGLVLLLTAAVVTIPLLLEPNDFRDDIVAQVKKHTGRDLVIGGDIGLSVFPWLGITLAELTLSQPPGFGDEPFAVVKRAQVRAKLLPLLKRTLEVDTLELEGLRLHLVRNPQGFGNWQDLTAASAHAEAASEDSAGQDARPHSARQGLSGFALGGVRMADARVSWDDRQAKQSLIIEDLGLMVGAVTPAQPVDIDLAFAIDNSAPALRGRFAARATVLYRDEKQTLEVQPLQLTIKDLAADDGLAANVALRAELLFDIANQHAVVSQIEIEQRASGGPLRQIEVNSAMTAASLTLDLARQMLQLEGLALSAKVSGGTLPEEALEMRLNARAVADLAQDNWRVDELQMQLADVRLTGYLHGSQMHTAPQWRGHLVLDAFNPRSLLRRLALPEPATLDPSVWQHLVLQTDVAVDQRQVALRNLSLGLDDSLLSGEASVSLQTTPAYRFALELDEMDLDRYLPPPTASTAAATERSPAAPAQAQGETALLPVEMLRQLDLDGYLNVGHLIINHLNFERARLTVKARQGEIHVTPAVGGFYRGSLEGSLGVNVQGKTPHLRVSQQLRDVQSQPLVQDLLGEDRLSGTGNVSLDLKASGQSIAALKKSLDGHVRFAFTEGAVKGLNLGRILREAAAQLQGNTLPRDDEPNETDFSVLEGSAVVAQGVLRNDDLNAKSPLFRVTGKGIVDIGEHTLDYKIKPMLVASLSGQGGEDLNQLKGVPIPVHLSGSLDAPDWRIDLAAALSETQKAKLQKKINQELENRLPKELQGSGVEQQLNHVLKGFFN